MNKKVKIEWKIIFWGLFILFFLFFMKLSFAFNSSQQSILDNNCMYFNFTFSQCKIYNSLFDFNNTNLISLVENINGTQNNYNLVQTHSFNLSLRDLRNALKGNFTFLVDKIIILNDSLNHLDFSKYNDTLKIRDLNTSLSAKISNLQNQFNKFSFNSSSSDFNMGGFVRQVAQAQIQAQTYAQLKKQVLNIFGSSSSVSSLKTQVVNLSDYYTKSVIDSKINSINNRVLNFSNFVTKSSLYLVYFLIFIVGIFSFYLFTEFKKKNIIIDSLRTEFYQFQSQQEISNKKKLKGKNNDTSDTF